LTTILTTVLIALVCNGHIHARTWHIERDGSGDFIWIQPAVELAADGDTILIGPGRYPEYWTVTDEYGQVWDFYVEVKHDSLTFIGAGKDATIIGPEDPEVNQNLALGFTGLDYSLLRISNLCIENINYEGVYFRDGRLEMDACQVRNSYSGIVVEIGGGGLITGCHFEEIDEEAIASFPPTNDFEARDCSFNNCEAGFSFNWGSQNCRVIDCEFTGGVLGCGFSDGSSGEVRGCTITGTQNYGIGCHLSGAVVIENNYIDQDTGWGIAFVSPEHVGGSGNIVISNANCLDFGSRADLDFHGNHFLRGPSGYFARTTDYWPYSPYHVDLTDNYWGTYDLEEIATWIFDGYDSDVVNLYLDYEPISGPVVGVDEPGIPEALSFRVFPNPFNPSTQIHFTLTASRQVNLDIFDLLGRRIAVLANRHFESGEHTFTWYGRDDDGHLVPSGTYLIRMEAEDYVETQKIMLVR